MLLPRHLLVGLAILLGSAACGQSSHLDAPTRASSLASLRAADSALQIAVSAADIEATVAFYADDAVMLPVAEPIVQGRDAIREEWTHVFGIPGYANAARLITADVAASGDLGYTRGTYESPMLAPDGSRIVERGKWVTVWKREPDGTWKITVDVYNTDRPPPDHQPSAARQP